MIRVFTKFNTLCSLCQKKPSFGHKSTNGLFYSTLLLKSREAALRSRDDSTKSKSISLRKFSISNVFEKETKSSNERQQMFAKNTTDVHSSQISAQTKMTYEAISNETLESLSEKFDQIAEDYSNVLPDDFDVTFSNGVLTAKLGGSFGTYVVNKQTPNLQIWLSSPISGPKRFDLVNECWVYTRTGEVLHDLLSAEISKLLAQPIDFSKCAYSKSKQS
jgi:frataxin